MGAQMLLTPCDGEYPRAIDEGGLMPYVLPMTTGQIGHPIAVFVLVISNDRLLHGTTMLVLQMEGGCRSERQRSHGMFSAMVRLVQRPVTVSRMVVPAAGQRGNTASALPHPDRSFRQR
jgi:hypothetical protein